MKRLKQMIWDTNPLLVLLCVITSAFGVLMVHSATLHKLTDGSFLSRESFIMLIAIGLGFIICLIISFIDYELVLRLWPIVALVCVGLMVSLFFIGNYGSEARKDAISWISIGGVNFQPSELVKIGFVMTFSLHLNAVGSEINKIKNVALLGLHGLLPIALVIQTGDLGSALVFMFIFVGLLYVSGLYYRYFAAAAALATAVSPVLWIKFFSSYQKNRFLAVYYPSGMAQSEYNTVIYQQQQGVNAIGSGQLRGQGLFHGEYTQSGKVPVSESDMIFSVIGEELGFLGAIAALLLIAVIIVLILLVARKSRDRTGNLLCYGIAIMIGIQTIINIGMCMKMLPCIGITLPFFSAGGSSNLCVFIGIGLVLSVNRFNQEKKPVDFRMNNKSAFAG